MITLKESGIARSSFNPDYNRVSVLELKKCNQNFTPPLFIISTTHAMLSSNLSTFSLFFRRDLDRMNH